MKLKVIQSDFVCDYCKNRYNFKGTGKPCESYYNSAEVCVDASDFCGSELVEVDYDR